MTDLSELQKSKTLTPPNAGQISATGTPIHCRWECEMIQPLWEAVRQFLIKLNIFLPYYMALIHFCIYPNELEI